VELISKNASLYDKRCCGNKYEGKSISKLQIVIEKKRMGITTYKQHLIFQRNLHTNLNSCPTVSKVPGNLRCKILVFAVGTTPTPLFQPHHRQESIPLKDVVLEDCLNLQAMFNIHGQHFFVDIICCHIFCPQKPHNAMLFYCCTLIQGRRHLVTAVLSLQSCAYRSLRVTIKLDSVAI